MYRKLLKAKIHRAVVTDADLNYEGSLTVDKALLNAAGIREFELIHIVDVESGARLETYTIAGEPGSGEIKANGAAARLVQPGDHIIIMSYALAEEPLPNEWQPKVILVNEENSIREIR